MKIGFIGAGNMGGALAKGISRVSGTNIYIYDKDTEKANELAALTNGKSVTFEEIASGCSIIFLGVKPNVIPDVASMLGATVKSDTLIVSMAAGVKISKIEAILGKSAPVIRIMPNTPVAVGDGLTAYAKNKFVSDKMAHTFENIMQYTGALESLDESEIDSFCAIAGCGPAYAYMFIEALAKGAEKCGIPRDRAIKYASKMIRGSALMALESGIDPETLCKNVCSPGGATIEGVKVLKSLEFESAVSSAIDAAFKRTKELGN